MGLTGGIASGKSTAARAFRLLGCPVIDADRVARDAVAPGTAALRSIRDAFGPGVLRPDGALDREALGQKVFGDPGALARLNRIVHPEVGREVRRLVAGALARDPDAVVVYDVPLLYETGQEGAVDLVVVVYVPPEVQAERLSARDGRTPEQVAARLAAQLPIQEKAGRADVVLDNRSTPADLAAAVTDLVRRIREHNRAFGG